MWIIPTSSSVLQERDPIYYVSIQAKEMTNVQYMRLLLWNDAEKMWKLTIVKSSLNISNMYQTTAKKTACACCMYYSRDLLDLVAWYYATFKAKEIRQLAAK